MRTLGCRTRSRLWRAGQVIGDADDLPDLSANLRDPSDLVWVDLLDPSEEDLRVVADRLGLDLTAVEDVLATAHERPKVTRHRDHLFFLTYATRLVGGADGGRPQPRGRLDVARLSGFLFSGGLVTIRTGWMEADDFVERWDDSPDLVSYGAGALAHGLLDAVVDGHFATIAELDDDIEALEDELFDDTPDRDFLTKVYGVRKDLVRLRRVVLPMREVVNSLLRHRAGDDEALSSWYQDLYDHVLRAAEWTESLRDMVSTVFETNLSMQDTRLNTIMKKLAAWAAIIAVPTAVTGWFGQNVPYPGFAQPLGLWLSVALIALLGGALYLGFRRRDWL